jgi:hypothetical protein
MKQIGNPIKKYTFDAATDDNPKNMKSLSANQLALSGAGNILDSEPNGNP